MMRLGFELAAPGRRPPSWREDPQEESTYGRKQETVLPQTAEGAEAPRPRDREARTATGEQARQGQPGRQSRRRARAARIAGGAVRADRARPAQRARRARRG